MKTKTKEATMHALCLKSTGEPSARAPGQKMLAPAQAAALNEDVLKHASVEWREVEEEEGAGARRCAGQRSNHSR